MAGLSQMQISKAQLLHCVKQGVNTTLAERIGF
jgi:hypothetical protein